jgi:hypothetical protein
VAYLLKFRLQRLNQEQELNVVVAGVQISSYKTTPVYYRMGICVGNLVYTTQQRKPNVKVYKGGIKQEKKIIRLYEFRQEGMSREVCR